MGSAVSNLELLQKQFLSHTHKFHHSLPISGLCANLLPKKIRNFHFQTTAQTCGFANIIFKCKFHANETYVCSPDFSRQISASCTAALRSSASSIAMSLALLFLNRMTDIVHLNKIHRKSDANKSFYT